MSLQEFLLDTQGVVDWLFNVGSDAWSMIKGNWILLMSFCLALISIVVNLLNRIKNIKK